MVDLPGLSISVPQVKAPTPAVSPAEVAGPYKMAAQAMNEAAGATGDLSIRLAKREGMRAASIDEQGNLQVEQQPVFGPAAETYRRAVKFGALAQGEGAVRRDVLAMRSKFENDPEGFQIALEEYRGKKVDQYDGAAGPEIGLAIGKVIDRQGTYVYRNILNAKRRKDLKEAGGQILGQANSIADDMTTLAESGATDSDDFQELTSDYRALLDEAVQNPEIQFTQAQADQHFETTISRAREAGFLGALRTAFSGGGPEAARAHAAETLDETARNPAERARLAARTDEEIASLEARTQAEEDARARTSVVARDSREREGLARLASGALTGGWLDRYGAEIGAGVRDTLRRAIDAPGGDRTVPAVQTDLMRLAVMSPDGLLENAADAMIAGLVTKADFGGVAKLAADVQAEQRPWANELRKSVASEVLGPRAAQRGRALAEVSEFLATTENATPQQAQEYADAVVARVVTADRKAMRAELPLPTFALADRMTMESTKLDQAHERTLDAARHGQITLGDVARQARLLSNWREAMTEA